ncbi:MAG: hypothetical protein Q9183_001525 [Haloplaca sp. 2 TL-2023]
MADNVDYNDLKRLIKIRTTRGQGEALTIPGHENEAKALQGFENEFYAELKDQHQRVDLFVQSKAGEIQRRLVHLDKQIGQLQQRYTSQPTGRISVKRLERFSKAEEAAEKAGEEIKSLARFVGAQKLAFLKLLKKYQKWTGSPGLDSRFRKKVLNKPGTFSTRDFQPLLTQYTDVLVAVRAPFDQSSGMVSAQPGSKASRENGPKMATEISSGIQGPTTDDGTSHSQSLRKSATSVAAQIQEACQDTSDVRFDTALATLPLGSCGGRACYWIHPDHLIELHVLLLQYTRLRRAPHSSSGGSTADRSRRQSPRESPDTNDHGLSSGGEEDAGLVVCDELHKYAQRWSSASISDAEEPTGKVPEIAAASIRYNSNGEAILAVDTLRGTTGSAGAPQSFTVSKVRKKAVRHLFDSRQHQCIRNEYHQEKCSDDNDLQKIRRWLPDHPNIRPLAQLQCKRTRFVGLKNQGAGGVWVTLDRDILMSRAPEDFFSSRGGDLTFLDATDGECSRFPFAVLEVRFEGGVQTSFLDALDKTHLTERIRGFSIEAHAVATLCKPQGMPPPYWLPALDQDLRKIPATVKTTLSREPSSQLSPSLGSGNRHSTSATSVDDRPRSSDFSGLDKGSSATSVGGTPSLAPQKVPKKKRRRLADKSLRQQIHQASRQRYWNEYDNGDEDSDNEPFAIYIDPNRSSSFPGAHTISNAASSLAAQVKRSSKKLRSWIGFSEKPHEQTSLLADEAASPEDEDSDLEDSPMNPLMDRRRKPRHYATFRDRYVIDRNVQARESLLQRCCVAFFLASFVLLLVATCLASAGRRKAVFKVDIGVITGVVFSLVFAVAGVGCTFKRTGRVGHLQRALVFGALTVVCVGSGVLLAGVVDG